MTDAMYKAAVAWLERGYNVVPQNAEGKKHPAVRWKEFQERMVTQRELTRWRPLMTSGIGFVTGAISGVIVIETDGLAGMTVLDQFQHDHGRFPDTLIVRSGSHRGLHYHFKHPGHFVPTTANPHIALDVRGDKGFCLLPPSKHRSGREYEIVCDAEPAELPAGLLEFIASHPGWPRPNQSINASVLPPGARSGAHAEIAGHDDPKRAGRGRSTAHLPPDPTIMEGALLLLAKNGCFDERKGTSTDASGKIIKIGWVEAGMALKLAYGEDIGYRLWEITHLDDRARAAAHEQWASFSSEHLPGHVTIGSLLKAASDAGFRWFDGDGEKMDSGYVSYHPFTMDSDDGLTMSRRVGRGREAAVEVVRVSDPFEVIGACRDPAGHGWGKKIKFKDPDGRVHARYVADAALQGDPATLCAQLVDEGLRIHRSHQRDLATYLNGVAVKPSVMTVERTGWHLLGADHAFVLPGETIALELDETVALDDRARGAYSQAGHLHAWQSGVGTLTRGHTLPMLAVSAAFAGPLLHLINSEGGGIHLYGRSSIGKSAALQAAASVWGRGATPGYVRSWRATSNGLEGLAAGANDTCLVLDELGVGEAREIGKSIYSIANGIGKARAARDGSARDVASWRANILSSGELPVEAKLTEERFQKVRAGQMVRLLDVPADRGLGYGSFNHGGDNGSSARLADALKEAARTSFGTAGPEFIRRMLHRGLDKVVARIHPFMESFLKAYVPPGSSEQISRAAKKFATIGAAGELAVSLKIVPWERGQATEAAAWALEKWRELRGGTGSHEEKQAIEQVRLVIEQHGEARFQSLSPTSQPVRDRLGWRKGEGLDQEWWIPTQTWREEVCSGLDPAMVARTLARHGMLRRQDRKHLQCTVNLGGRSVRVYALTAAIFDGGEV